MTSQPNPMPRSRASRWAYLLSRVVAWIVILAGVVWFGMIMWNFILWSIAEDTPDERVRLSATLMGAFCTGPYAAVAVFLGLKADLLARRYLRQ